MPADRNPAPIHDNSPDDPDLALTPPQRLRAFAEFMAIGLRRLHDRARDAPDSGPALAALPAPEESSEIRTNGLA